MWHFCCPLCCIRRLNCCFCHYSIKFVIGTLCCVAMLNLSGVVIYLVDVLLIWVIHVNCRQQTKQLQAPIDIIGHRGCVRSELVEGSRVQFDDLKEEFTDGSKLEVQFKTAHTSGLIFYASRRHDGESLIAVHLHRGYLRYTFRCRYGSGQLTYSRKRVNDNKWHTLIFGLEARSGIVYIDGQRMFRDYFVSCPGFTTIVFGGVMPTHFGSSHVRSLRRAQLDGCLRRTKISTGWTAPPHYYAVSSCTRD